MIQLKNEIFTAQEAVGAGLIDAIRNGTTRLECHVEVNKGELIIDQRKFAFVDKNNNLRSGIFKDESELVAFYALFYPEDDEK